MHQAHPQGRQHNLERTELTTYRLTPVPEALALKLPSKGKDCWSIRSRCQGMRGSGRADSVSSRGGLGGCRRLIPATSTLSMPEE